MNAAAAEQVKFLMNVLEAREAAGDPRDYFEARTDAETAVFAQLIMDKVMRYEFRDERKLYFLTGRVPAAAEGSFSFTDVHDSQHRKSGLAAAAGIDNSYCSGSGDICGEKILSGDIRLEGQRGGPGLYCRNDRTWTCWARKGHAMNHRAYDSSGEDAWGRRVKEGWIAEWAWHGPDNRRVEYDRCEKVIACDDGRLRDQRGYNSSDTYGWTCYAAKGHAGLCRAYDSSDTSAFSVRVQKGQGYPAEWDGER